jgi:oligosaccharide repeat unit polymerase
MTQMLDIAGSVWIPVVIFVIVTLCIRGLGGSWLAPDAFIGLVWSLYLPISLAMMDHRLPALGVWALVSLLMAVQLGAVLGEGATPSAPDTTVSEPLRDRAWEERVRRASRILTSAGFLGCLFFVYLSLSLFDQSFDFASLLQMSARWTFLRYDGFLDPWPLRVAAIWVYPAALLGGCWCGLTSTRRERLLGLLSLVPCTLLTFLSGGRAAFLVGLSCWLGGNWSFGSARATGRVRLFGGRSLLFLAATAAGLVLLFLAVNALRGARNSTDVRDLSAEVNSAQIRNYMFGAPAAFAAWFDRGNDAPSTWGARTVPGMFDLLGIRGRTLGTYDDSVQTVKSEGTNIYTIFRGLVEDFTLPGAFVACMGWGFLSARAHSSRSFHTGPALVLAAYYSMALFSPLYCFFSFNSSIFAWLVVWLLLRQRKQLPALTASSQRG